MPRSNTRWSNTRPLTLHLRHVHQPVRHAHRHCPTSERNDRHPWFKTQETPERQNRRRGKTRDGQRSRTQHCHRGLYATEECERELVRDGKAHAVRSCNPCCAAPRDAGRAASLRLAAGPPWLMPAPATVKSVKSNALLVINRYLWRSGRCSYGQVSVCVCVCVCVCHAEHRCRPSPCVEAAVRVF